MGDTWPYGPPHHYSQAEITYYASTLTGVTPDPNVMGAIAIAESGGDAAVINDTPSTEDYSVGLWQINYYDGLYSGRAAAYGTPQQLVQGGIAAQARAMVGIWRGQGYGAWSTYTNGAYRKYLGAGPVSSSEPTIQEGASGPAVSTLQIDLNLLGAHLATDGQFGPLTRAAVIAYQQRRGLTPDGIVGPITWAALFADTGSGGPPQAPGQQTAPLPGSISDDSWSSHISVAADYANGLAGTAGSYATAIYEL